MPQILDHKGRPLHYDDSTLERLAYNVSDKYNVGKLPFKIPTTFEKFYKDFGPLEHDQDRDKHNRPKKVKKLAPYQIRFANLNYGFMLKCNKIGMTTSEMLCDFWTRLLPQYAGFDVLLCASKLEIANDLLMQLKTLVNNSAKYRQFLIKAPQHLDFSEERSKVGVMYIANPYNPARKSRIIAIGNSATGVYSRMRVNRIHISDPSRLTLKNQDDFFAGLFSRISNTGGQIKIEGVPGKSRTGWFWKMSKTMFNLEDTMEDAKAPSQQWDNEDIEYEIPPEITRIFTGIKVTIDEGVKYNVIKQKTKEFLQATLPPSEFKRTCMGEFPLSEGAAFNGPIFTGEHEAKW